MLSAQEREEYTAHTWIEKYHKVSSWVPLVPLHRTDAILRLKKKKGMSVTTHVYQIILDSITSIPIPQIALQLASKNNSSVGCRISISLFDLESLAFFGKTWKSPNTIPIIGKLADNQQEDSDSESSSDRSGKPTDIDKQRANFIGNKLNLQLKQQVSANNKCVYFHTHLQSKHVICAIELSFEGRNGSYSPRWFINQRVFRRVDYNVSL
jgi:hypothetical protein